MIIDFAYLRVSDESQNLDRQYIALKNYKNIPEENVYADKITGKTDDREEYNALKVILKNLNNINMRRKEEDRDIINLTIEDLDRLGRTKKIIRDEMRWFEEHNIRLHILEIPTTLMTLDEENQWVLVMVNKILIEVYTTLAEQELKKKERRTREGIEAAKLRGVYKGRVPIKIDETLFESTYKRWKDGEITAIMAMGIVGLKPNTWYRRVAKMESREVKW